MRAFQSFTFTNTVLHSVKRVFWSLFLFLFFVPKWGRIFFSVPEFVMEKICDLRCRMNFPPLFISTLSFLYLTSSQYAFLPLNVYLWVFSTKNLFHHRYLVSSKILCFFSLNFSCFSSLLFSFFASFFFRLGTYREISRFGNCFTFFSFAVSFFVFRLSA